MWSYSTTEYPKIRSPLDILTLTIGLLCLAAGFIAGIFIALRKTHRAPETDAARAEAETLRGESAAERRRIQMHRESFSALKAETEKPHRTLKNDGKRQGNRGKTVLESNLESSGLIKDRECFIRQSLTSDEGRRPQPDVMINLPGGNWVIADSKVSLTAYERYAASEDEAERKAELKSHIISLITRIKGLPEKKHQEVADGQHLGFILLFVLIEPAYQTALNVDLSIFNEVYDKGIIMVCPGTLIASLKIIAFTRKHEYRYKNTLEIAKRGKLLSEKFINFVEDMRGIGTQLERTDKVYRSAMRNCHAQLGRATRQLDKASKSALRTWNTNIETV